MKDNMEKYDSAQRAKETRLKNSALLAEKITNALSTVKDTDEKESIRHYFYQVGGRDSAKLKDGSFLSDQTIAVACGIYCKMNNIRVLPDPFSDSTNPKKLYPAMIIEATIKALVETRNEK